MKEKGKWTKWIYWFTFAVAVILVYNTVDNFGDISNWIGKFISIIMPFLMGILIAYLLYIPCRQMEKLYKKSKNKFINKKARGLSVLTIYIIALLIIIIAITIIIPALSRNIMDLANNLPRYYQNVLNFVDNMPENSIIKKESIKQIITNLRNIDITKLIDLEDIPDYIKGVVGFARSIFNVCISVIMSVHILLERKQILRFIRRLLSALFKKETSEAINNYFMKANDIFFKFISSQIIDGMIVGTIVSIALCILRVKYWLLLGFMIGLFNVIPYIGAIISVTTATIVTVLTGGFSKAIWMLVVVLIIQQLDANIINPKIIGNALKLSPILVISSVTVFGAYYGILGMFLAVPITALIKILVNDFIDFRLKKKETTREITS